MAARPEVELPAPTVRFGADFLGRLGRLTLRLAGVRERREGEGRARLFGTGAEFVGFRPYRSGEDLRALDWSLLARLGRPYVRVAAREASERWAVLLDTSASMGLGSPGKLQLAAEVATALAAVGLARKARVELCCSSGARAVVAKRAGLRGWMRALEGVRAGGRQGAEALASDFAERGDAGRVFVVGDLLGCEPREVLALARPSRELFLVQILAHEECTPPAEGTVRWIDAESGARRTLALDPARAAGYEQRLGARLEGWRAAARAARAVHGVWTSGVSFETVVNELCRRAG